MLDIAMLSEKFNLSVQNEKIVVGDRLLELLEYLKCTPEYNFNLLTSVIAVDYNDKIEIIYQLYSVKNNESVSVSYFTENKIVPSVIKVFKSAYFDECEIFDMFGIQFEGNNDLKRLLMPDSWLGHPLLKSYELNDERLCWNE